MIYLSVGSNWFCAESKSGLHIPLYCASTLTEADYTASSSSRLFRIDTPIPASSLSKQNLGPAACPKSSS